MNPEHIYSLSSTILDYQSFKKCPMFPTLRCGILRDGIIHAGICNQQSPGLGTLLNEMSGFLDSI